MLPPRIFLFVIALLVSPPGATQGQTAAPSAPLSTNLREKEIAAFEALDRANPPKSGGIVFVGSSSIRKWQSLGQDSAQYSVLNRGFGGSQLCDSVQFVERIVIPYQPRMVVLYAGGNDIHAGKTPQAIFKDFQNFTKKMREHLPSPRIAYISIVTNQLIESYIQTQPDMNEQGYKLWSKIVLPFLAL
jgi:GDSL-like Lipase/Acylhydrolase family